LKTGTNDKAAATSPLYRKGLLPQKANIEYNFMPCLSLIISASFYCPSLNTNSWIHWGYTSCLPEMYPDFNRIFS